MSDVTMISSAHMLFLGKSSVSSELPPQNIQPAIKQFEVFYDDRVVVGFHVVAVPGDYVPNVPNGGN